MPRTARDSQGGYCYHVLNRGNLRAEVFHGEGDFHAFVRLIGQASARIDMWVLAYCLMPNHFHLALWPEQDGHLSRWMHWLLTAHVRRYRKVHQGKLRHSLAHGTPFGDAPWTEKTADRLGLEETLHPPGRPQKESRAGRVSPATSLFG